MWWTRKPGKTLSTAFYPKQEAPILSLKAGWAEQEPESWWNYLKSATAEAMAAAAEKAGRPVSALKEGLAAIGISYQMHGLVCVDRTQKALRPAIIWCDSRAVPYGQKAMETLGADFCLSHLLNSPGNFTASKLAWVKEHEPEVYEKIDKVMLPGDYIAMRLTGTACTTVSGLSEGMFWDFKHNCICKELMEYYGFSMDLIPEIRPTFSEQGRVTETVAEELGIKSGIPVTYRAGDQPNNALSLNVFNPGEIASTAGTSGVVYGVNGMVNYDPLSRVNTFAHVNHAAGTYNRAAFPATEQTRLGVLLCINGTGILNSWVRRNVVPEGCSYEEMNRMAESVPVGSEGSASFLSATEPSVSCKTRKRAAPCMASISISMAATTSCAPPRKALFFSFRYGIDVMKGMGMDVNKIHAGQANMFLSPLFRNTLAGVTGAVIELYETDGSVGAAKGAGIGAGIYKDNREAFSSLERLKVIEPDTALQPAYEEAYQRWLNVLQSIEQIH